MLETKEKHKRGRMLSVRFTDSEWEALKVLADMLGMSRTDLLRKAVNEYVKKRFQ